MATPTIIWSGPPGELHTNNTEFVQYQFICELQNTCGECLQYHMAVKRGPWGIPLHHGCNCRQEGIGPGEEASTPFVDFRQILDKMPHDQQVAAIGASNYKLLDKGVVQWKDIVTPSRVRSLREVVAIKQLNIREMTAAGVNPRIAAEAYGSVHTAAHQIVAAQRAQLTAAITGAGLNQDQLTRQLAQGLAGRVSLAEGPASYAPTYPPAWPAQQVAPFTFGSVAHAAELQRLLNPPPPPAPPAPPAAPVPPAPPRPPVAPVAPAVAPVRPEEPTEEVRQGGALEKHDMGLSDAKAVGYNRPRQEAVAAMFGRPLSGRELASVVGAPDGSEIFVSMSPGAISVMIDHPAVERMERTIRKNSKGELTIHNDIFKLKKEFQQSAGKLGLKAFAREVQFAHELGVQEIETNAHRNKHDLDPDTGKEKWSGYYVWPRYGYDGPLNVTQRERLKSGSAKDQPFANAKDVSEVMASKEGREWWMKNGSGIDVTFDLKKGSYSLKTLNKYLDESLPVMVK
jgi:hypothetical protein